MKFWCQMLFLRGEIAEDSSSMLLGVWWNKTNFSLLGHTVMGQGCLPWSKHQPDCSFAKRNMVEIFVDI